MLLKNIESKVQEIIEPIIVNIGYELYDVEYVKEASDYYLRIYIDKDTRYFIRRLRKSK